MRPVRAVGAVLLWVLASVLAVLSLLLCITVILLPLGAPLLFLSVQMYKRAVKLALPRGKDVRLGLRKGLRLREARKAKDRAAGRLRDTGKDLRGIPERLRKRLAV